MNRAVLPKNGGIGLSTQSTTTQTVLAVALAAGGQTYVALNQKMFAVISCEQNNTNAGLG